MNAVKTLDTGAKSPTPVRLDELPKLAPTAWQLYFVRPYRDEEQWIEYERRFFSGLRLKSGVFKSTDAGRLAPLDELVSRLLPEERPLRLMDVAVSSGVTTADWMEHLDLAGAEYEMAASDLVIEAWLLSLGSRLHVLVDGSGHPLQYDVFGRGIRTSSAKRAVDLPLAVVRKGVTALVRRHVPWKERLGKSKKGEELLAPRAAETVSGGTWGVRRVLLVSGRLLGRTNLRLFEEDLLAEPPAELRGRFHVVRAANILSRGYFSDDELRRMIANLRSRLVPRGLLAVCRTEDDGTSNATVFRLNPDGGLTLAGELGAGANVRDLVLESGR